VTFDVVVVGARCAGAALATHLARGGASVALLDAARLPSDQGFSTHLIQPAGVDELDRLGLGDAVRAAAPAIEFFRQAFDDQEARLPFGPGRAARCLRREPLDALVQGAAVEAGAELRDRTRVCGLVRDRDGRVCGVEARRAGGPPERISADLVVGADGRHSTVARLAGAREYLGYDGPRGGYWAYWERPPSWDPREALSSFAGDGSWVVFPTDGDLVLIAVAPPLARVRTWRGRHAEAYLDEVRAHARVASHLDGARPVTKVRGVVSSRYFFRASAGPGWALAGDAGHHKEFVVGLGITDALRDAHSLADAALAGRPSAIREWWRRRDVERIEMFHWARDLGRAQPVTPLQRMTAAGLAADTALQPRFGDVIDGRRSPYELVPTATALGWAARAVMRGEPGVLPALSAAGRRRARAKLDLWARSVAHANEVQAVRGRGLPRLRPRPA
jgi:flavin-dependent dehydrogenase